MLRAGQNKVAGLINLNKLVMSYKYLTIIINSKAIFIDNKMGACYKKPEWLV